MCYDIVDDLRELEALISEYVVALQNDPHGPFLKSVEHRLKFIIEKIEKKPLN